MDERSFPLVTVVVPCYNVERYLARCLDSLARQTYKNLEVILVDDGSSDGTASICADYVSRFSFFSLISQHNQGLSAARNVAICKAKGEFVTFVDSDDFVADNYVRELCQKALDNDADVAVSSYVPFFEGDAIPMPLQSESLASVVLSPQQAIEAMFYQGAFDTTAWGKIYRTELFADVRYPVGLLFEDLPTTYRLFARASKVVFSDYKSYYYMLRNDSIEGSAFSSRKLDSFKAIVAQLEGDSLLDSLRDATHCRIFSFVSRIFLSMPLQHPERPVLWQKIKSLRWKVLLNLRARRKAQLAAFLSLFGASAMSAVYRLIKTR